MVPRDGGTYAYGTFITYGYGHGFTYVCGQTDGRTPTSFFISPMRLKQAAEVELSSGEGKRVFITNTGVPFC